MRSPIFLLSAALFLATTGQAQASSLFRGLARRGDDTNGGGSLRQGPYRRRQLMQDDNNDNNGGGGGGGGSEPCGSIQCAVTPEPIRPIIQCEQQLNQLRSCLDDTDDGTYSAGPREVFW